MDLSFKEVEDETNNKRFKQIYYLHERTLRERTPKDKRAYKVKEVKMFSRDNYKPAYPNNYSQCIYCRKQTKRREGLLGVFVCPKCNKKQ